MIKAASTPLRYFLATVSGVVVGAAFMLLPVTASASSSQGFQVSPPENVISLNPGTSTKQSVKVTNLTDTEMNLTVATQDFAARGDLGEITLTNDAGPLYSLAPWFTVSARSLSIAPLSTQSVSYTIAAPVDAEPGGRYGAIVFSTIPPKLPNGESGASVQSTLASLVLLSVSGNAHQQLEISSFKSSKPFYEYGPIPFQAIVKNVGNVHEKPTGQIVIKNMLGLKTGTISVTPEYVLPVASRLLTSTLDRHFMFGRYTAAITVNVPGVQILSATTSFWVIPYKIVGLIIIILILLILFFTKTRKRFRRAFRILAGRE